MPIALRLPNIRNNNNEFVGCGGVDFVWLVLHDVYGEFILISKDLSLLVFNFHIAHLLIHRCTPIGARFVSRSLLWKIRHGPRVFFLRSPTLHLYYAFS